jgi:hypothetical protein
LQTMEAEPVDVKNSLGWGVWIVNTAAETDGDLDNGLTAWAHQGTWFYMLFLFFRFFRFYFFIFALFLLLLLVSLDNAYVAKKDVHVFLRN